MRALWFLWAVLLPFPAAADTFSIGPGQSQVRFIAKLLGHSVSCSFGQFSGKVTEDPAHPDTLTAEAKVEVASIATGIDRRNRHLCSPDYFDADKYPEMTFRSRSVHVYPNGDSDLIGDLTIKQTTKSVALHVHPLARGADAPAWDATAQVDRKDFGITRNAFSDRGIGDTIDIILHIQAQR